MAFLVIKRDKTREVFQKTKIEKAVLSAGDFTDLSEEKKKSIAKKIAFLCERKFSGKKEVKTSQIREFILKKLEKIAPPIFKAWLEHEKIKKKYENYYFS